jgi:hypothetical protein
MNSFYQALFAALACCGHAAVAFLISVVPLKALKKYKNGHCIVMQK